jgi:hypothetical protein
MIGIVMAFPGMVMHYKGPPIDTSNVKIEIPAGNGLGGGLGGLGGGLGGLGGNPFAPPGTPAPAGGATPGLPAPGGLGGAPNFGTPAAPAGTAPATEAPAAAAPAGGLDPLAGPPPGLSAPAPQPSN